MVHVMTPTLLSTPPPLHEAGLKTLLHSALGWVGGLLCSVSLRPTGSLGKSLASPDLGPAPVN